MVSDRDMLELCLDAFKAVPVAGASRKFMKQALGLEHDAYAGNRSHILAAEMVKRLQAHLGEPA